MSSNPALTPAEALTMLCECFGCDAGTLHAHAARDAVPGWDSMGALMLIAELDERFGLELTAERSRAMRNVADVLEFLRAHGVLSDAA